VAHCVQNTGDEPLVFPELSKSARFVDVSLSQWLGSTPPELVQAHLNLDAATMAALTSDQKTTVA